MIRANDNQKKSKVVLHIDLNSFFASCHQQDEPSLRGKPLGVVQDSGRRSVIIGSSREAKALGIGTAASIWEAKKICPEIVLKPARFERYVHYSRLFRGVCSFYSDQVEVFSIDELFMDVTHTQHLFKNKKDSGLSQNEESGALRITKEIKRRMKVEVGSWLSCSAGIAPNKMLAKLASASKKPDGLVLVDSDKRLKFLDKFKLWHICGIGHRIERRLNRLGVFTIKQMRQAPVEVLKKEFGVLGQVYYDWAWGRDTSKVLKRKEVEPEKSFGNQVTLPQDMHSKAEIFKVILNLCWQVAARMREKQMGAKTVSLWLRGGKEWAGKQFTPTKACATAYDLYRSAKQIYRELTWDKPVRFVGITAGNLMPLNYIPLSLLSGDSKREEAAFAWDKIAQKYGPFCLRPGSLLMGNIKDTTLNGFSKRFWSVVQERYNSKHEKLE